MGVHTPHRFSGRESVFLTPEQRGREKESVHLFRLLNRSLSLARTCGLQVKSESTNSCIGLGAPGHPREMNGSLDELAKSVLPPTTAFVMR